MLAGIFQMKTYPLHTFVHRVLVLRLAVAAALMAVVVGVVSYSVQQSQIEREVVDLGHRGALMLLEQVQFVMERQRVDGVTALREVLAQTARPSAFQAGSFVHLQVYDRSGTVLSEKTDTNQPGMDRVLAALAGRARTFPALEQDESQVVRIDGRPFVFVTVPIADRESATVAFVRGVFAVAPAELIRVRRTILRNTVIAIVIVIGVSVVLYPVILQLTTRLADYSTHLLDANLETLSVLGSAIAKRDSDTDAHNYRVTLYSTRIGEAMNLPQEEMRILVKGSFLHDVGKLGIPDSVLLKPAKLDEQEFATMKTHVDKGSDIVGRSTWLQEGKAVVAYHHEKFAGGGYPNGLKGPDIPITARIFAVSDVFDALTSQRPYKKPLSFDETMSILEQDRGRHFDPSVLDSFSKVARGLYDRYAGHEGADLKNELDAVVQKYFSAGMDTLRY
ncbi:MAG: HD domain-containing protein [Methanothrix sp.]|nr:HD domain-containing protein [Methanothrix sp.]